MSDYTEHLISMAGGDGDQLAADLAAADDAYTAAVSAAAGGGDWAHARQAREAVKQARAALTAGEAA
jgi:hypothetical protein